MELHRRLILFCYPIEPAELDIAEGANRLEAAGSQMFRLSYGFERGQYFVPGVENDDESHGICGNLFRTHLTLWIFGCRLRIPFAALRLIWAFLYLSSSDTDSIPFRESWPCSLKRPEAIRASSVECRPTSAWSAA